MIDIVAARTEEELSGILHLQQQNLPGNLSPEAMEKQGFVTVSHRPEDLRKMNDIEPHVIAKDGDQVVGYLLAMTTASKADIPVLKPMFEMFDGLLYKGKPVSAYHYLVVGQVCIADGYRGQGLLERCYEAYRREFDNRYDFAITEINTRNLRSMRAHEKIGFTEVHRFSEDDSREWSIVAWDWQTLTPIAGS